MLMDLQLFAEEAPKEETPAEASREGTDKPIGLEERLAELESKLSALTKEGTPPAAPAKEEYNREAAAALLAKLRKQEAEARELYPKLSLKEELKDPRFAELLKCGLDVRSAFEVVHKDEILCASMEYAAREVERMMTNKLMAEGKRPMENGGDHGPAVSKTDVKAMTRQDRKDIIRRVRMGEKITF